MSMRALCIAALLLLGVGTAHADDAETDYRIDNGMKIPGTDINVGSYGTASLDNHPDTAPRLAVDALSLFVWWDGQGRWKFFSELEYENLLYTESNAKGHNGYLSLERLYAEYALTDAMGLRAGKFLTPIGRWNEIHATPLVWTTSRPLATQYLFPDNMSGVMLDGSLPNVARGIDYTFYASNGEEIRPNPALDSFREAVGAHILVNSLYGAQFGFSYVSFEQEHSKPGHNQLIGGDFLWTRNRFEIMAEAAYRRSDAGSRNDEWGGYVQFVAPLSEKLYGVARYENLHLAQQSFTTQLRVAGLNYKLSPHLILKIEWAASHNNRIGAPDGLLSSVSVLL